MDKFFPIFISILAVYIAYQQWQTNERERRHALFEKRYNLVKGYNEVFDTHWQSIKNNTLTTEMHHILVEQSVQKWHEAQFLIKNKDTKKLIECIQKSRDNIENYLEAIEKNPEASVQKYIDKHEYYTKEMHEILEQYLRIEPEETIWGVLKNWAINCYEFWIPKWLQRSISKITSVILNLFQDLASGKNSSKKDKDGEIPNQVRNDEKYEKVLPN
ncbi:MAG: hypothetical protein WCF95_02315 [bacterium]